MKNYALKMIIWVFITIIWIILFNSYNSKEPQIITENKIIETDFDKENRIISQNYNQIVNSIWSIDEINKCDKIKQENLVWMCRQIIKDKFSLKKNFKDFGECDNKKDTKENIEICKYNLALRIIKSKDEIDLCEKIWNTNFIKICETIINNRYTK